MATKGTGAARQARQRAKGVQVAVILPPHAAADLDEAKLRLACTTKQALTMALHVLLEQLREAASKASA